MYETEFVATFRDSVGFWRDEDVSGAGAAEGAVDAANILKPALARGKFRCIGATTNDEYRKYERRFQKVPKKLPLRTQISYIGT